MSTSLLENLYRGNINPVEDTLSSATTYQALVEEIDRKQAVLQQSLSKEQSNSLVDLGALYEDASIQYAYAGFCQGLKLGTLLMAEIFQNQYNLNI